MITAATPIHEMDYVNGNRIVFEASITSAFYTFHPSNVAVVTLRARGLCKR